MQPTPELTEDMLAAAFDAIAGRPVGLSPTRMLITPLSHAVLKLIVKSGEEYWNWRRLKRELRRPMTSTYSKPRPC